MEQFLADVEVYAAACGVAPTTIVQRAGAGNGVAWAKWKAGTASCSLATADKVRAYMAAHPPLQKQGDAA